MAYAAITSGINQEKGITYSGTTDNSGDWTGVPNSTYFYDKATDLAYYKDSSGVVLSIFVAAVDSIYTDDGTLTGNRTVDLDGNSLAFEGGNTILKAENTTSNSYTDFIFQAINTNGTRNFFLGNGGEVEIGKGISNTTTGDKSVDCLWGAEGLTRGGSGQYAVVVGSGNNATFTGTGVVAIGKSVTTSIGRTAGVGENINLGHENSYGFGRVLTSGANESLMFGTTINGNGRYGAAIGHYLETSATGASLIGNGNTSTGVKLVNNTANSLGLGWGTTTPQHLFKSTGGELGGKTEFTSTTDGFLMNRLTTAQKNAISSPDTNLMVFDTDLSSLQRYNGTAWVAMAAGYGVIGVVRDSDNGSPIFYSDLQSALETCKTAGSSNTINIYSNITITSAININRGGSGVGNGYQYKDLTIDFNGFTLTNNEADSSYCFDVSFGNIASENRQITFKNGTVNRTSGTGTHYVLHCDETENDGHLIMSNMRWYCENSNTARLEIDELDNSYKDFGGSVFISDGGQPLMLQHYSAKNFTCIGNSSSGCLSITSGARATNFEVENTSTGDGIDIGGDSDISFFKVKTDSGIGLDCSDSYQGLCSHFYIETTTGDGIDTLGTNATYKLRFSNFEIRCDNGICIDSNHRNTFFSNFTLSNNGSSYTISASSNTDSTFSNGTAINYGSGQVVSVGNTNNINFKHVDFISKGGSVGTIGLDNSAYNVYFENCTLHTEFDDAAGVNLTITNSTGTIVLTTCSFRVVNNSANCIYATSAKTISLSNSNFKGATTPINSNVNLSNTFTSDPYGNITI